MATSTSRPAISPNDGVVVLLGAASGDGTFPGGAGAAKPPEYAVDLTPGNIASGDLDADGNIDLVTANQGGESIDILRGKGDGTFFPSLKRVETTPSDVKIGDFNEDGLPDIVVSNNRDPGGVTLLLNTSH